MIDWKDVEVEPPAKDRLILATSGWGWRREDTHTEAKRIERTKHVIPARHYKHRSLRGTIVMLYWVVDDDKVRRSPNGGWWTLAGMGSLWSQPFRYWAEANNPLTIDEAAAFDSTLVVQNVVPDVETMTPYVPSEEELVTRQRLRAMGF